MKNKVDRMYYDSFANEYCSVEDVEKEMGVAPPERFLLTLRGVDNSDEYVECYECNGLLLSIAYTEEDIRIGLVNLIRFAEAEKHKFPFATARMIRWTIPAKKFDEYTERFGIVKGDSDAK